jgi:hypothetical protein
MLRAWGGARRAGLRGGEFSWAAIVRLARLRIKMHVREEAVGVERIEDVFADKLQRCGVGPFA